MLTSTVQVSEKLAFTSFIRHKYIQILLDHSTGNCIQIKIFPVQSLYSQLFAKYRSYFSSNWNDYSLEKSPAFL